MNNIKKISSYGECDKDYCYLKKNPIYKKARLKGYKWRVRGKNVNGRNGYHHIVKEISLNYFHNDAISIYNKFIEKYMSNINKYESIVQLIDQKLKNENENVINNYKESKLFNQQIEEYKNKIIDLINSVLGKKSVTNIYDFITKNIGNNIAKYFNFLLNKNEFNSFFYLKIYKDNFKKYLQIPHEVQFRLNQISENIINIGDKFSSELYINLKTKFNMSLKVLYYKLSDIINNNYKYLKRNIPL